MTKTDRMRVIELERGQRMEDLIRAGIEQGQTLREIADDLGVSYKTLHDWKEQLGGRWQTTMRFASDEADATPVG